MLHGVESEQGITPGTPSSGAAASPLAAGPDRPGPAADAVLRATRWLAAALVAAEFWLYRPDTEFPYSRWWGLLPVGLLVLVNVVGQVRESRRRAAARDAVRVTLDTGVTGADPDAAERRADAWYGRQLAVDTAVVVLLSAMLAFDRGGSLWVLPVLPVMEAMTRGWRGRGIAIFVLLAVAYVVREEVAGAVYGAEPAVGSILYRLGVLTVIVLTTAGLAGRLARQLTATADAHADAARAHAEADRLRALAVATRRMSSLDVPTVVREVTAAAEEFGFTKVQVRSRAGAVLGSVAPEQGALPGEWFERAAALAAAADSGFTILSGPDAGTELAPDEALVVADVTVGQSVEALLLGRLRVPFERGCAETLSLLAAQASAVLGNALRYEEGRAFEERLAHQATHDDLTGLPNRTLLRDRARSALARARRAGTQVGVVVVDLDRFQAINDVHGHAVGDGLLQAVADRLSSELRAEDTCARLGGDEFVLVVADQPDVDAMLALARRVHAAVTTAFDVGGHHLDVDASVGLAWAPDHGDEVDDLLRSATVAMSAAKSRREGLVVYSRQDDRMTPVHLTTLGDLRRALNSADQLYAVFQPIVSVTTDQLVAVEALLRWNHPVRGSVAPDQFIPMAESSTVIHQLTDHVLNLALGSLTEWIADGLDIDLAVNLSARTLLDVSLCQRLESILDRHAVDPARLRLEITESTLLADPTRAISTMHRLRDLGVRLSIDDFGTGYSSMNYLRSLPVDEIKIDRSFVTDMLRSAQDGAVVHSVIDLAHSLGLHVVAEGVEDADTLDALCFVGCDLAQGYHVARPMTAHDLVPWAREGSRIGPAPAYHSPPVWRGSSRARAWPRFR